MGIEWRGPIPQSNYTVGRNGGTVDLIVDHWTVVMFEGAIRRFKDPASRLSAHYVIGQDGRIEHEAGPAMEPTDALYATSAQLHLEIADRHGLVLDLGRTVLPHRAIVPTECPGSLDLDRIVREATEEDDMTRLQRWLAKAIRSVFPNADLSGPDVDSGQPFKG